MASLSSFATDLQNALLVLHDYEKRNWLAVNLDEMYELRELVRDMSSYVDKLISAGRAVGMLTQAEQEEQDEYESLRH